MPRSCYALPARTRGSTLATTRGWLIFTRRWGACGPSCHLPATWAAEWRDAHDRLEDLRQRVGEGPWAHGLARVTDADREVITHLLTGSLDT